VNEVRLVFNKKYVLGISDFRAVILDVLSLGQALINR
jgi:hypothetical protein